MPGCSAVGSAPALGAGCRGFESLHSDQKSKGGAAGAALVFFTGKGFEGRAAQSKCPVDTCDRERPSAHCALFRRIPGKHCCAGLRSTASSNLTGASLPAFSSLFSTIYLAIRCRFFAETERGARIESLHSDQSENPVVQAAGFSLCIVPFSIFSFQYSLRIDRIF